MDTGRRLVTVVILIFMLFYPSSALARDPFLKGKQAFEEEDYIKAAKWFSKAAEQGNANAQSNLGVMHIEGQGVPQDYKEAAKWISKAAVQGNAGGQNNLGMMYGSGQGVPQNYVQAYMWFNLSAAQGEKSAILNREIVLKKMTPSQIEEGQRLSKSFKPKKKMSQS